jgi:hypothetical protein
MVGFFIALALNEFSYIDDIDKWLGVKMYSGYVQSV